jgi:hypothetical protein
MFPKEIYYLIFLYIGRNDWLNTKLVCRLFKEIGDKAFVPKQVDLNIAYKKSSLESIQFILRALEKYPKVFNVNYNNEYESWDRYGSFSSLEQAVFCILENTFGQNVYDSKTRTWKQNKKEYTYSLKIEEVIVNQKTKDAKRICYQFYNNKLVKLISWGGIADSLIQDPLDWKKFGRIVLPDQFHFDFLTDWIRCGMKVLK